MRIERRGRVIAMAGIICCAIFVHSEITMADATADNRALVGRFVEQFYTRKDVKGAFEEFVDVHYIQHNPGLQDGRDAAIAALAPMFAAPGAQFDVKHMLVDGNLALIHLFGKGDPATAGAAVVDLYRLNDGRIVEHWDVIQAIAVGTDPLASVQGIVHSPAETATNRILMTKFIDILYRRKQVAIAYATFVAPHLIEHSPGRTTGRDAAIAALRPLFAGANASFSVKHVLVDGNLAAVHYLGHINAESPGAAVVEIFRVENGKIVEHWDAYQPIPKSAQNAHPMF